MSRTICSAETARSSRAASQCAQPSPARRATPAHPPSPSVRSQRTKPNRQIPIASKPRSPPRGFLPWRLPNAGLEPRHLSRRPASETHHNSGRSGTTSPISKAAIRSAAGCLPLADIVRRRSRSRPSGRMRRPRGARAQLNPDRSRAEPYAYRERSGRAWTERHRSHQ